MKNVDGSSWPWDPPPLIFMAANASDRTYSQIRVVALDAQTGRRIWHYQIVHHDLWDRDLPCPPSLITVKHDGRNVDASPR